ncbi:DsbA family oxidoreductase [Streptomyces litchfieldiae]|uniref:DsbA family oxidoreductase n=1 Tax=Streptomyces litchfieldiae TaxID=3075543 RepID=A0ABU2MIP5_9ACTN|nr:DsbA family oxidoreductase [Streptomyces sp. DSM 44938]MDT0341467.1 DsbA family oxidoreductase [Streptomyces sp. DSM 44938]
MNAFEHPDDRLVVDVWSDVMCPFCYIGDTLLAQAVEKFPHGSDVEIRYHSFQLMPHLPADLAVGVNELLEKERGIPRAQARAMNAQVAARAAEIGLDFRMDSAIATNSRAAHRLIHFARSQGRQHDMVERLFRAFFTDGLNVGDHDVLTDLATQIGLAPAAAREALDSDTFDADVDADVRQAGQLGITGVPFFVFGGKYAVSGAQPLEVFLQALDTAWKGKSAASA